ncbi:chromosome segregation protein SMC [Lysinibacillus macroides]|uniref:Chromosome partition protein Smc n=1 Tax=Lysinibacillus macroides TaxID=33935 RepID=A0A0M9DL59_9BACI|nr:chromosome segregation protein SMC [Lysinibacillus macroides]KOY82650.1 chromosome segregation protein SMC [Lysinibacillus macroides]QPR66306.1 chromosome segregation protein SMC [Lysinibacillus macroides]
MFLKRLEVIGFKSFAERIGIDFVPGVTAVVGPNGSGKSNVTDAIRWVLGEQSAKSLRGAKMEDVIFAGSDSRKPLNFAEVTLVLDNTDEQLAFSYTEVSVTRRVYRSGDSEYLLNNQQCRLKDITDLFMDSGLGKEAFSIISQGRVDEILNSRPDDRRAIFEEAAGVLKYKIRKKKAEHKLVETDENLYRVLDILHELDNRLEPLEMQASNARDYVQMSTELKDFDIAILVHDFNNCAQSLHALKAEFTELSATEQKQAQNIAAIDKQTTNIRKLLTEFDTFLDTAQAELVAATMEVERWDGRKALMAEKRQNASNQLQQLQGALQEAKAEVETLLVQEQDKKEQFSEKQQAVLTLKHSMKQLEQSLNRSVTEIEQEIEESKNRYIDSLNEEATIKNELKNIDQQLTQHKAMAARMSDQTNEIGQELMQIVAEKDKLVAAYTTTVNNLQEKLKQQDVLQQQLKNSNASFTDKQEMLYKAYQHQQQLKARKDTLAELEADFSGFFQGVKEVLLARDKGALQGIEGAVAELIQVEGKFSQAIETALGAASQHIVTTNERHAQQAIHWLKQKRAGRATFLPKTVMKSRKLNIATIQLATEHPAFIQMADALVTFNEANRTIVENLLGNVIVAANLEGASQIARLCGFRYRVVTLDGDIVNAGGSLTGGASKQQSSLFSRKAELEDLIVKLESLHASIYSAEQAVAVEKAKLATLREQVEQRKLEGEQLRKDEMQQAGRIRELEAIEKSLSARVSFASTETQDVKTREEALLTQKQMATERLHALAAELIDINHTVEQLTKVKLQGETEKDVLREQLAEKRSQLAVMQEQMSQVQIATAEIALQLNKAQQKVENISQEIAWLQSDASTNHLSDEEIDEQVVQWKATRDTLQATISQKKEDKTKQQQELATLEEQLKEVQRIHKGYLEAIRANELKRHRLEFEMDNFQQQLEENYQLTIEEAKAEALIVEDEEHVRRRVKLLKKSIEELGPVNISAIEEYERVLERHTFLTEQREDLLAAQETLHEAIKEMDEEMTLRFSETFYAIREQFKHVFRELFGGGQADLVLIDPQNLLETGIEIVAQPPGKKLQNLSLLSGGERALTAIALLFSILNIRPVPFCILDEVEAALDEANVVRYSQYLKKFSRDTQFIVITHRKGTMEGADVLYGITMQESGVSKLVSVKLEDEPVLAEQRSK